MQVAQAGVAAGALVLTGVFVFATIGVDFGFNGRRQSSSSQVRASAAGACAWPQATSDTWLRAEPAQPTAVRAQALMPPCLDRTPLRRMCRCGS